MGRISRNVGVGWRVRRHDSLHSQQLLLTGPVIRAWQKPCSALTQFLRGSSCFHLNHRKPLTATSSMTAKTFHCVFKITLSDWTRIVARTGGDDKTIPAVANPHHGWLMKFPRRGR